MSEIPKDIEALINELELIGADKITQPQGKSRRTCTRAARLIRDIYKSSDGIEVKKSSLDS